MKKITEIKRKIKRLEPSLKKDFSVKKIGIFGSYLRGEEKKRSDLDILVEFNKEPSFFVFLELEEFLSNLLNVKVDLVMKDSLKPNIGKQILREVVYL